jgi:hypothetical protein
VGARLLGPAVAGGLLALAALACGAGSARPKTPEEVPIAGAADAGAPRAPVDTLESMHALVSRGEELAPGMRLVVEDEVASPGEVSLPNADADLCVRAAFVADAPVRATLISSSGDNLATIDRAASGVLGARGPVCARKGQVVTLRVEEPARRVRIVVWAAP